MLAPPKATLASVTACLLVVYSTAPYADTATQQLYKLDNSGSRLNSEAITWSCVEDASTGLFWQKRDPSNPLHNLASYTWYQPEQADVGTKLAYPNTSPLNVSCSGYSHDDPSSYCNTDAYVERVNQTNYCGYSDWRLPTADELVSLAPSATATPYISNINLDYFPFYDRFVYWTNSVKSNGQVLTIVEETRVLDNAETSDQLSIRLVRGTQY